MHWLRPLFIPAASIYAAVIRSRNRAFDTGRRPMWRAPVPVISVGNLTVGGTGKTPMVIEVVRMLRELGKRPAVLTRGYRSRGGVSDEAQEIAVAADVPVVIDPDRCAGARTAVRMHMADVLVMDDGFQHRRLARDLDLVLVDALDPWGGGWTLPAGRLREPRQSLRRAQAIVITRANQAPGEIVLRVGEEARQFAPGAILLHAEVVPSRIVRLDGSSALPDSISGRRVMPVCGLGNPGSFLRSLQALGADAAAPLKFPDHYAYSPADAAKIAEAARNEGIELVLTTRKDWTKLRPLWEARAAKAPSPTLGYLEVTTQVREETLFRDALLALVLPK